MGERTSPATRRSFSGQLMANNIRVGILALALGADVGRWGPSVVDRFLQRGHHGRAVPGLPARGSGRVPGGLAAAARVHRDPRHHAWPGRRGSILGGAVIGWGRRVPLRARLAAIRTDLVTLILGVALMLVWAGIVEAFFSQYHEPVLPYWLKIVFGSAEAVCLVMFLALGGRGAPTAGPAGR